MAWVGTYVQTRHDDREDVVGQGVIDLIHDQDIALGETRIALDYGITRQFGASLVIPVRVVSTSIRYLAKRDGSEVELVTPGIHHRDETLAGIADPMLLGSFTNRVGPVRVVLRGGVTVPIGRTEDNPFTAEAETMPHEHVQMGTGTVMPVIAADVGWAHGAWRIGGFAFTQQSIYENHRGYKTGDRYAGGIAVSRRIGKSWSVRGGAEVQGETAEHWAGVEHTDDGNRGRIDAMVVAGGSYAATDRLTFDAALKVPFVTKAVGGQLEIPAIVEIGASWRFGTVKPAAHHHDHAHEHGDEHADGDEHDHGDEHADADEHDAHAHEPPDEPAPPDATKPDATKPDATKPDATTPDATTPDATKPAPKPTPKPPPPPTPKIDIADYAKNGDAPDLVPVRGKITIFDFGAAWCAPCKTLEPALVEIARKHPSLVAIRKLDVVDWDSKAAARYLTPGGFNLPHLVIYDAAGKRVMQKSSEPGKLQALIDEVKRIVDQR